MYPDVLQYDEVQPYLDPNDSCLNITSSPVNGATFGSINGTQILVDLLKQDFLVSDSLLCSYRMNIVTTTANAQITGTPCYAPINSVQIQVNGQIVETLPNYNQLMNIKTNLTLDSSQKQGSSFQYGYSSAQAIGSNDGRLCAALNETWNVSFPLSCILSNCKKYFPLFLTGQVRLIFNLEPLPASFLAVSTAVPVSYTIDNFLIGYELFHSSGLEATYRNRDAPINIRSLSFYSQYQPLASGISGQITLNYNVNFQSIKSAFICPSAGTLGNNVNGQFDYCEVTQGSGQYAVIVGGKTYPPKPINVQTNKAMVLTELKKAMTTLGVPYGTIFDKSNNFDITQAEFSYVAGTLTSLSAPSKFIVGVHLEVLHSQSARDFWSGVSSKNSAVQVQILSPTATPQLHNVLLILCVDAMLTIDPKTGIMVTTL
jgi:hypothetical protein